jgi:hypothetical protein
LAVPLSDGIFALFSPMLSDRDAEEIERGRREGVGGPIVLKWLVSCYRIEGSASGNSSIYGGG